MHPEKSMSAHKKNCLKKATISKGFPTKCIKYKLKKSVYKAYVLNQVRCLFVMNDVKVCKKKSNSFHHKFVLEKNEIK